MRDIIPRGVFDSIQRHLVNYAGAGESGWESASADEDTITGRLGAKLETDWSRVVRVNGERWRWRFRYKKFQGRGRGAFEKSSGADGIVQVEVDRPGGSMAISKGMLFQAKKNDIRHDRHLIEQIQKMETLARGCSACLSIAPTVSAPLGALRCWNSQRVRPGEKVFCPFSGPGVHADTFRGGGGWPRLPGGCREGRRWWDGWELRVRAPDVAEPHAGVLSGTRVVNLAG